MNDRVGGSGPVARLYAVASVLVLALAAQLHLGAALRTRVDTPIRADAAEYTSYAYNLRWHGVYSRQPTWHSEWRGELQPDAVRQPGYALVLALLIGETVDAAFVLRVVMLQALLSVLLVGLSQILAKPVVGRWPALVVALLVALTPQLVTSTTYVLTETLYATVFTAFLCLLSALLRRRDAGPWLALACGLLLGASALVRPTSNYLPLVVLPFAFLAGGWRHATALALGVVLAFGPWILRNLATLGRSSDPTLAIATLQHGSYPNFMYDGREETYGYPYRFDPRTPEIVTDFGSVTAHIANEFARQPWTMTRWYLLQKPLFFLGWEPIQGAGDVFVYPVLRSPYLDEALFRVTRDLMHWLHVPLMALSLGGALLGFAHALRYRFAVGTPRLVGGLAAVFLAVLGLHMVGAPFPRYSVPFRPLMYTLGAWVLVSLAARCSSGLGSPGKST